MPGMNSGLNINDPIVVAAFRSALLHQGIIALLIFAVLSIAWVAIREWRPADPASVTRPAEPAEPVWRQVLRIGFGLIWVFDGILQAQPAMAVGLPSKVIEPAAATSPHWVQHLLNWAGTAWSYHPVQAGASAVWIQVGIGLWLLFAPRGTLSRLAGVAAVAWGLVVWVFGEALGQILAPGLSWLDGAPGAALIYAVAGLLVALPTRYWHSPWLARLMTGGLGVFLAGMALLQAWPGRGFWQGTVHGQPGPLASMASDMAGTPQPAALSRLVSDFGSFTAAHGLAVNLVVVLLLALLGGALIGLAVASPDRIPLAGRGRWLVRVPFIVLIVFCLAVWVLVQDFGFFGGLGTDPNSMIPVSLLAVAAYEALVRPSPAPAAVTEPAAPVAPAAPARPGPGWRERVRPAALSRSFAASGVRTMLSACAIGVIILGAAPMAAAQASRSASPILAEAVDGSSAPLHSVAPGFALTDQNGQHVSLAGLHGKAVLLTFLDPVCTTDCPLEAQEFREAGVLLGAQARHVELVAVNVNPLYNGLAYTRAFDREQSLTHVRNWVYLTGSPAQLRPVWRNYGIASETLPAGSMLGHNDVAFVIDPNGHLREELDFDPGPGTTATVSSFASELAIAARQALASR
jgi:cytochrome oxidase Cu insertion factor (SCO1/SenC/PrrC family)